MEIINKIKDGTIVVCENEYKNKLVRELTNQKLFLNVKFYTKSQFFKSYLFSHDEKALVYLVKKYHWKPEIAKMYLDNLYFIDKEEYCSNKLGQLVNIKNELVTNNLLIFDNEFKNHINNYHILVWGYGSLENYEEEIFNKLNAEYIKNEKTYENNHVYEFTMLEEEVNFVAKEIASLLQKKIDINKIKIVNADEEYYNTIQRIFNLYNIPVRMPCDNSLYSNSIAQKFLNNLTSDIKESIKIIENEDNKIVNKIVSICNKYVFENNFLDIKPI